MGCGAAEATNLGFFFFFFLFSILVCCQPTELILGFFLFDKFPSFYSASPPMRPVLLQQRYESGRPWSNAAAEGRAYRNPSGDNHCVRPSAGCGGDV